MTAMMDDEKDHPPHSRTKRALITTITDFPREVWSDHWRKLRVQKSLSIESTHRRKDGHTFPVELSLHFVEYNGQEYNFAFGRDITLCKQKDEALQLLTTRLLQLQDEERRRIA